MKRLWVILFVIPVFAQDPCSSKEFLRLKNVNIKNMTEREYQYFMMMSEKCSDSDGETLLEKLLKTRVEPAEVLNYPFNIPTKQEYPSKDWSWSSSFGFSSEKVTISFFDGSLLYNIDEHSELYGALTYMIFGGGIGLGYKYYIGGKSKSSMFVNTGAQIYVMGENHTVDALLNTAAGLSLKKTGGKTSFNIGISLLFPVEEIIPFINLQRRL
tara:strand:+ start:84 stop:722 length:639 start_codon:yes stop_codon:yes gene_type:complete